MKKYCFYILIILVFTVSIYSQTKFKDFTLTDLDGNVVTISSLLNDNPVFITFWRTNCKPSLENIGELKTLQDMFNQKGVLVLAVVAGESKATVRGYKGKLPLEWRILLDRNNEALNLYVFEGPPIDMLITKSQKIIYYREGYYDDELDELRAALRTLSNK